MVAEMSALGGKESLVSLSRCRTRRAACPAQPTSIRSARQLSSGGRLAFCCSPVRRAHWFCFCFQEQV